MKKTFSILLLAALLLTSFAACSFDNDNDYSDKSKNKNENTYFADDDFTDDDAEDSLSGIWDVVEGGDDHTIIIANGNIQIIDGSDSEIFKYTKPSDNVFRIELYGDIWEFKYKNGYLYRYENGEKDGYVYQRTAYNSNK